VLFPVPPFRFAIVVTRVPEIVWHGEPWRSTPGVSSRSTGTKWGREREERLALWNREDARRWIDERRRLHAETLRTSRLLLTLIDDAACPWCHGAGAMGIMGWSSTAMAARYQHMTDPIRRDIAKRVGGLLWAAPGPDTAQPEGDDPDDGKAGGLAPIWSN
jgi:hypothetical protein